MTRASPSSIRGDGVAGGPAGRSLRRGLADFWVGGVLMRAAVAWPALVSAVRPLAASVAWALAPSLRRPTMLNARRILGRGATRAQCRRLSRRVVGSHYGFIADLARHQYQTLEQLQDQIGQVHGFEHYEAARRMRAGGEVSSSGQVLMEGTPGRAVRTSGGAGKTPGVLTPGGGGGGGGGGRVIVTAHLGSFEVGTAALRRHEPRVQVVFERDRLASFEACRQRLRRRLGVGEAAIGDGIGAWLSMRDTLLAGGSVLMQADRAIPGQKAYRLPFLGGHALFPAGPLRLAAMTGSVVLPVFAPIRPDGKVDLWIEPPIRPDGPDDPAAAAQLAQVIERYVVRYAGQWLMMQPACEEDA